jgi:dolichyl-phosphate beta-glucosyltransferase
VLEHLDERRFTSNDLNAKFATDACILQIIKAEQDLSAENAPATLQTQIEVIVPAYNEEETISATIEKIAATLGRTNSTYRILVVDDGSEDGTSDRVLEQAKNTGEGRIMLLRNSRNMGKGFAIKRAAKHVNGEVVAILDADLAIDPKQLQLYIGQLKFCDMCIASKRHPNSVYRGAISRKILSVGFNNMVRLATGLKESDTQAGFKVMKTGLFKKVMGPVGVKKYAYDVEMLLVARLLGARVAQMPVRVEQASSFRFAEIVNMLKDLLGIAYRFRVKKWYQQVLVDEVRRL